MTVLVVGSVALDSVETPFGRADDALGGSATYFAASASHHTPVQLVGVVGNDYPMDKLRVLEARGVDLSGLEQADGESFRWRGRYRHDLNSAETLETRLGVFSHFRPKIPAQFKRAKYVFLGNIDPRLQIEVLSQVDKPKLVACDTMNFWIESRRDDLIQLLGKVDLITLNDAEARQLTGKPTSCARPAGSWPAVRRPSSSRRVSTVRSCSMRTVSSLPLPTRSIRSSIRPGRAILSPEGSWATSRRPTT